MGEGYKISYGMEVSASRMVCVRTVRRGVPQPVLVADLDSEEARRQLETISREVEKGTAALALCAPAAQTVIRSLRAPFASARKAGKVWNSLLDVNLPFPVESASCCYSDVRVESGGTVSVAAAIRTHDLETWDEASRAVGLESTHCDAEALALWSQQGVEAPSVRSEWPRAIVWLGEDHVTIARGRGTTFVAAHVLRASPLTGTPEAQQTFDALWAARMRQVLTAHLAETGSSEMDLWWAGPGAEDEARVARLRKALPAELSLRQEVHRQPSSFLVRALARRAIEGSGVNFKTGEWTHPAVLCNQKKALTRAYVSVAATALLVLVLNMGISTLRQHRVASLQVHLSAAAQSITGQPVPLGQESLLVERAITRRDEETQPFRNALDTDGLEGRFARVLDEAAALDVQLSRLVVSPLAISIEGSATSIQAIEGLAERLRAKDWLVQTDSPGRSPEGRQQFILKGTANHEG